MEPSTEQPESARRRSSRMASGGGDGHRVRAAAGVRVVLEDARFNARARDERAGGRTSADARRAVDADARTYRARRGERRARGRRRKEHRRSVGRGRGDETTRVPRAHDRDAEEIARASSRRPLSRARGDARACRVRGTCPARYARWHALLQNIPHAIGSARGFARDPAKRARRDSRGPVLLIHPARATGAQS